MRNGIVLIFGLMMMLSSCQSIGRAPVAKHHASPMVHLYNNVGADDVKIGNYESGLKNFDQALWLDPDNPDVALNIVNMYSVHWTEIQKIRGWDGKKIYDESLRLSRLAVKSTPGDFSLWESYGWVFIYAEDRFGVKPDWREAAKVWKQARRYASSEKQLAKTWLWEGRVHRAAGNPEKAANCLQQVLKLNSTSAEALAASQILKRIEEESKQV